MNEYSLYERTYRLHSSEKATVYEKKLLALIVYKNLFPQDYALIYEKKGLLYTVINQRRMFDDILTGNKKEELVSVEAKMREAREKILTLRRRYLDILEQNSVKTVSAGGKTYPLEQLASNDHLWNRFMKDDFETYHYVDDVNNEAGDSEYDFLFSDIEKDVNKEMDYEQSARNATSDYYKYYFRKPELEKEIREIEHTDLRVIFRKAGASATKPILREIYDSIYEKIDLEEIPQIDVIQTFIYNGYIGEDYYMYISQYYPGTLSPSDYKFVNDIRQGVEWSYDTRLNNVEAIVKKLRKEDIENKTVLNYDILDYLIKSKDTTYLPIYVETARKYPDFIVSYYHGAKKPYDDFFNRIFEGWNGCVNVIQTVESDVEREQLLLLFFKVLPIFIQLSTEEIGYLENQYEFICNHIEDLNIIDLKDYLKSMELVFNKLVASTEKTKDLYDFCLNYHFFRINASNMAVVLGDDYKTKSITALLALENEQAKDYMKKNLLDVIATIPDTSKLESKEALVFLLGTHEPSDEWMVKYLSNQYVDFDSIKGLDEKSVGLILIADKMLPAWHLVLDAFNIIGSLNNNLTRYLVKHASTLMKEKCLGDSTLMSKLHQQLFEGEIIPFNEFRQLMRSFIIPFSLDEIQNMPDERIAEVIKQKKIGESGPIFNYLNTDHSTEVADEYLILHFDSILNDESIDINKYMRNSMGIHILNSRLTLEQKKRFMDKYLVIDEAKEGAKELAFLVCFYQNKSGVRGADHELVLSALQLYQNDDSWEQKINLVTLVSTKK